MAPNYSIKVYKQYFNFASSHFLVFEGKREPIHGHNYRVRVSGSSKKLASDMVFDFLDIKPIVRDVCDSLDHRLLLPSDNPWIKMSEVGDNYNVEALNAKFSFPKSDCLILPLPNVSAECLAIYLWGEIKKLVKDKFNFEFSNLEVEVEETTGQSAIYSHREDL